MSLAQMFDIQKRLQSRKEIVRTRSRNRLSNTLDPLDRKKPSRENRYRSTKPGKLYHQFLYPKSYRQQTMGDTPRQKYYDVPKLYDLLKNQERLPSIKQKSGVQRVAKSSRTSKKNYLVPTASYKFYARQNKQFKQPQAKRICSVRCLRNQLLDNQKRTSKSIQLKDITKLYNNPRETIDNEETAGTKSRSFTMRKQLKKMKEYIYTDPGPYSMRYDTYFGMQPEFYKLKTEYIKDIYNINLSNHNIQNYRLHNIPSIPSQELLVYFIERYRPFNKEINLEKLIESPHFFVEHSPRELFFGQMINGQREGMGILIVDKTCFEGLFKDNWKVQGIEVSFSGVYKGQFYNDLRDGIGQFTWINGETYIGDWKRGRRHGSGVWTNQKGDSYNGDWFKGKGRGYGMLTSEGRQYNGDFYDFKKDGWGRQKMKNGDTYEGGFKGGLPEGKGVYIWANGTKYQGQFQQGFRSGKGILSTIDGFIYNGQFIEEKPQGFCQLSNPNGDVYSGYLRNGKKNGRGVLTLEKGMVKLDGYWQDDRYLTRIVP